MSTFRKESSSLGFPEIWQHLGTPFGPDSTGDEASSSQAKRSRALRRGKTRALLMQRLEAQKNSETDVTYEKEKGSVRESEGRYANFFKMWLHSGLLTADTKFNYSYIMLIFLGNILQFWPIFGCIGINCTSKYLFCNIFK